MKKFVPLLLSLAVIALLGTAAHYLIKANEVGPPSEVSATTTEPAAFPAATSTPTTTFDEKTPDVASEGSKNIDQKIDASSDKAMVDSLDYISRQLDKEGQQQLQDDYNIIAGALTDDSDATKSDDSLAKVREAINGKTAAELSDIADKLMMKQ